MSSRRRGSYLAAAAFLLSVWAAADQEHLRYRASIPDGLDLYLPVPATNVLTPEKVRLGRRLFSDPMLSRDLTMSCATCHDPQRGFADGKPRAVGIAGRVGARHTPALINRGYGRSFFWDGRAHTLEDQSLRPIEDPDEFGHSIDGAMVRLRADAQYQALFQSAFGREPQSEDLARALASYVRTILAGSAPIDRYLAGDPGALTDEQRQGLAVFRGRGRCTACHAGPTFADERFHNTGVAWREGRFLDPGRAAVTNLDEDRGAFKTPTLREVGRTAPYMHDGSFATLAGVVDFYAAGGRPNPNLDPDVRAISLTPEERRALLAFLGALTGTIREGELEATGTSGSRR
jgi:cytochrome c peroxidase